MNLDLLLKRLLRKPTCRRAATSRIHRSARIVNLQASDNHIRIGAHTVLRGELLVFAHGGLIEIGDWCYIGEGTRIWSGAKISIGHRVMIAHNVNVFDNRTHPLQAGARHAHFRSICETGHPRDVDLGDLPVTVEDDAWIGAGAMVLRGVKVGRGAIVAAGAVLTQDLAPGCIAAGNPARVIGSLDWRDATSVN
jgi:acetyltransferase-like isoleucine patch superfamily enzyme